MTRLIHQDTLHTSTEDTVAIPAWDLTVNQNAPSPMEQKVHSFIAFITHTGLLEEQWSCCCVSLTVWPHPQRWWEDNEVEGEVCVWGGVCLQVHCCYMRPRSIQLGLHLFICLWICSEKRLSSPRWDGEWRVMLGWGFEGAKVGLCEREP